MVHPLLQNLFSCLCEEEIRWCLLDRSTNLAHPTGNINLLIDREHIGRARQIVEEQGFVQVPGRAAILGLQFLTYHEPSEQCIRLHVVSELCFGPYSCFKSEAAAVYLDRRQRDGSVFVLALNDGFWRLLFHCLFDKRSLAPHDKAALQQLVEAAQKDDPLAQIVDEIGLPGRHATQIIDDVRRGNWTALEHYGVACAAAWRRQDPRTRRRLVMHRLAALGAILFDLRRRHGLSVAVLGPDGAGKSTVAEGIRETFCLPVQAVYMGLWQRRATLGRHQRLPGARLARLVLLVASRPFFIWSRYLTAQYHQALGRLVIFDRYVYDSLLPPRPPLAAVKRPIFWLLAHLCPPPDLVFLLDAPGRLMAERKAEYSEAHLEAERQRFLSLQKRIPKLHVVDASRDLEAVRRDILGRIWRAYVTRWTTSARDARLLRGDGSPEIHQGEHHATDARARAE